MEDGLRAIPHNPTSSRVLPRLRLSAIQAFPSWPMWPCGGRHGGAVPRETPICFVDNEILCDICDFQIPLCVRKHTHIHLKSCEVWF